MKRVLLLQIEQIIVKNQSYYEKTDSILLISVFYNLLIYSLLNLKAVVANSATTENKKIGQGR